MRIIQSATPRPLNLLAVGPNGLVAAATSTFGAPGDVEVWEATTGRLMMTLREPAGAATGLAFAFGGARLLKSAGGLGISACNTNTWRFHHSLDHDAYLFSHLDRAQFAVEADDVLFATDDGLDYGRVSCWRLGNEHDHAPQLVWQYRANDSLTVYARPALSFVTGRVAVERSTARSWRFLEVRAADTGKELVSIPLDPASPVRQLAFTADGAKLLVRTDGNAVQLFDAATGTDLGALKHKGRPFVTGIAVHPRGPVACARTDGTVTMWDAEAREQLRVLDWKAGRLVSVAFAPDGALAAAGTEDGKVIVWDVDE